VNDRVEMHRVILGMAWEKEKESLSNEKRDIGRKRKTATHTLDQKTRWRGDKIQK